MIYWTGVAAMIAGAILLVSCASMLAWHQQRRLAAIQTRPDIGGLEAACIGSGYARIGPEYYDSCL
jgi:hypothetical protein